jgi:hypothetical protein
MPSRLQPLGARWASPASASKRESPTLPRRRADRPHSSAAPVGAAGRADHRPAARLPTSTIAATATTADLHRVGRRRVDSREGRRVGLRRVGLQVASQVGLRRVALRVDSPVDGRQVDLRVGSRAVRHLPTSTIAAVPTATIGVHRGTRTTTTGADASTEHHGVADPRRGAGVPRRRRPSSGRCHRRGDRLRRPSTTGATRSSRSGIPVTTSGASGSSESGFPFRSDPNDKRRKPLRP